MGWPPFPLGTLNRRLGSRRRVHIPRQPLLPARRSSKRASDVEVPLKAAAAPRRARQSSGAFERSAGRQSAKPSNHAATFKL